MFTDEMVLEVIGRGIVHLYDIKRALNISQKNLIPILNRLVLAGKLYHNPNSLIYGLIKVGTIEIKDGGYGFISVSEKENDYYVSKHELTNIYDGDIIEFYPCISDKLLEAKIIRVIKRKNTFIIGTIHSKMKKGKQIYYITSNINHFDVKALIKKNIPYEENLIVYADINYVGTAIEAFDVIVLGHKDDPGIEISQIALEYGFKLFFPLDVIKELSHIPDIVLPEQKKNRRDFTDRLIFTIDGNDSKDFDDAISLITNEDGTYELGVYIADVAEYVKEGSPLDKEALKRGTSVYLADRVIPMLPHQLSNGICSLNEGVERLVLACLMTVTSDGKLLNYEIVEGVIKSRYQMTYENVNKILNGDEELSTKYHELVGTLKEMVKLSEAIRLKRMKKGALDFKTNEYKFKLNEDGSPKEIMPVVSAKAEKLIEDFMLMANETIAYNMKIMNFPCLYRIHEKPDQDKLKLIWEDIKNLGVSLPKIIKDIKSTNIQAALKQVSDEPLELIVNNMLLRGMMKAKYSHECIGHYALAMYYYCHFTSPIRRYPDLMVHRIIKRLILHPEALEKDLIHFNEIVAEVALQNSLSEKNSIECERAVNDMLFAWYMEKRVKKVYKGIISSVTNFGLFVTLDNGVEGLISLNNLYDYYEYDPKHLAYFNGKNSLRLGAEIEIVVLASNRKNRRIDFMLLKDYKRIYEG